MIHAIKILHNNYQAIRFLARQDRIQKEKRFARPGNRVYHIGTNQNAKIEGFEMKLDDLRNIQTPFNVINKKTGVVSNIVNFSDNDPLGVGDAFEVNFITAFFENGGWIFIEDLIKYYELPIKQLEQRLISAIDKSIEAMMGIEELAKDFKYPECDEEQLKIIIDREFDRFANYLDKMELIR